MIRTSLFTVAIATLATIGCTSLPSVDTEVCGNKVLEPGEDCDGFAPEGSSCGDPVSENRCFFTCDATAGTTGCPEGYGCGEDGRCRQASGEFTLHTSFPFPTERVHVGDLDGDRTPDLIGVSATQLHVVFGDGEGGVAARVDRPLPNTGDISVGKLNDDALDDLAVATAGGINTYLGRSSRELAPTPYLTFEDFGRSSWGNAPLGNNLFDNIFLVQAKRTNPELCGAVAFVSLMAEFISEPPPPSCGSFLTLFGQTNLQTYDANLTVAAEKMFDLMIGPLDSGDLRGFNLVQEVGVGFRDSDRVFAVDVANLAASAREFPLGGGHLVSGPTFIEQMDGALSIEDIVVVVDSAGGTKQIATRLNNGAFSFDPMPGLPLQKSERLLAVGDINGDGVGDYVFDKHLRRSDPLEGGYQVLPLDLELQDAEIVDINNDGKLDFLGVPEIGTGVVIFLQVDAYHFTQFFVGNEFAVADRPGLVEAGDYDGDLVDDVAIVVLDQSGVENAAVVFGTAGGTFENPKLMGPFDGMSQFLATRDLVSPADGAADLIVVNETEETSIAVFRGSSTRQLAAPRIFEVDDPLLEGETNFYQPLAALIAKDGEGERVILAPACTGDTCLTFGAFLVDVETSGQLVTNTETLAELPDETLHACMTYTSADVDGIPGDELLGLVVPEFCPRPPNTGGGLPSLPPRRLFALDVGTPSVTIIELPEMAVSPTKVQAVDLDGDGDVELVLSSFLLPGDGVTEQNLTILWNENFAFTRAESVPTGLYRVLTLQAVRADGAAHLGLLAGGIKGTIDNAEQGLFLAVFDEDHYQGVESTFPAISALGGAVIDFNSDGVDDIIATDRFSATVFLGGVTLAGDGQAESVDELDEEVGQ